MDHRIFNMRADVNECYCTQGCTDTVRESALKVELHTRSLLTKGTGELYWGRNTQLVYKAKMYG